MMKKILYFLFACDVQTTVRFLRKQGGSFEENKSFPIGFIRKSRNIFEKRRNISPLSPTDLCLFWKNFCKNSSYEEVLPVVLYGILKYPKEKIYWLLKVSPETLSYRLDRGFSILKEELDRSDRKSIQKEWIGKLKTTTPPPVHGEEVWMYCQRLAEQALPEALERVRPEKKNKKVKYMLWSFLCLLLFIFVVYVLSFILSSPGRVILYSSFFYCLKGDLSGKRNIKKHSVSVR